VNSRQRPSLHGSSKATAKAIEEQLFAEILANEPGWQERAFRHFHGLVHRLLTKAFGPSAEVGEMLDDVFMSFFASAHRIRSSAKVRNYIVSITMNRIRHEIRKQKRQQLLHNLMGKPEEIEHRAGNDDPKAKAALIQLSRVLGELDGDERSAFLLRSLEGMAFSEIAEALDISESTALRWTRRATEHVMKRVSRNALLCDYIRDRGRGDGGRNDGAAS
jgi:RNA polymerase sigma-70 factor (ECF subfamily)